MLNKLPECMQPDGAQACGGYNELYDKYQLLRAETQIEYHTNPRLIDLYEKTINNIYYHESTPDSVKKEIEILREDIARKAEENIAKAID